MKRIAILSLSVLCFGATYAQTLAPIKKDYGKLSISVDPRLELSATALLLSGHLRNIPEYEYTKDQRTYFKPYTSHKVTEFICRDTIMGTDMYLCSMLYVSQVPEMEVATDKSNYYLNEAGEPEAFQTYLSALKDFARESAFDVFWETKAESYRKTIDLTIQQIGDIDLVDALEKYYGESQNSYNIVICPLLGPMNFGPRVPADNGGLDIYSINGATLSSEAGGELIPFLGPLQIRNYVWHEFNHSFVNPLVSEYWNLIEPYSYLLEPIKYKIRTPDYRNWYAYICETIVRAVVIRLSEINLDPREAQKMLEQELADNFIYIEPVIGKLKEFEKARDADGITFSEFFPGILTFLEERAEDR